MVDLKSKHAFGAEANIDNALKQGLVDAYDILFLTDGEEHKIGWIDKDGNKVILEDKKQVKSVEILPEAGDAETVYICDQKFYFWDGATFVTPTANGGVSEIIVDEKIESAKNEITDTAKAYTDEQIEQLSNAVAVVEF